MSLEHSSSQHGTLKGITGGGLLVALGIIYGDIGTSPLYVLKAIIGTQVITDTLILGALSCVFWTLTILTTIKYVIITLRADNKGEGGIFSLYTLVRRTKTWLIFPAIIGGSTLLADGLITPPISVASAVEGLRLIYPDIETIPIVIAILSLLFFIQQYGTKIVGQAFGPLMTIWFGMLAILGIIEIWGRWEVLSALNPYYAYQLLVNYPGGFWLLGGVFLCTTGAEALYSDLGHCGRANIRVTWTYVKIALLLNYFGQGAYLLEMQGNKLNGIDPFFSLMPTWFLPTGILIATMAAIIASQALITGSFTLVAEAIRLNLWPKLKIVYPTNLKGQMYIPILNWLLWAGCIGIMLYFEESAKMEGAYGVSIIMTMIMTSMLLIHYFVLKRVNSGIIWLYMFLYFFIEGAFLVSNLSKFMHGGYVTILIAALLIFIMWVWHEATHMKRTFTDYTKIDKYLPQLTDLSADTTVPKYATHLVYLSTAENENFIEKKITYSIFKKSPKRADTYWFLHVETIDEPYEMRYEIKTLVPQKVFRIEFQLGFRIEQRLLPLFKAAIENMVANGEVNVNSRYPSLDKYNIKGDVRYVMIDRYLSYENTLPAYQKFILETYYLIKNFSFHEERLFGLDASFVEVEKVPLMLSTKKKIAIKRHESKKIEH
jgi:KUP system potassium uptake protein